MRTTQSGIPVASFAVACQQKVKNKETGKYGADFINCVAGDKTAEFVCRCFQKGSKILIEGRIQTRSYEKDGIKRWSTEVVCENVEFGGSKGSGSGGDSLQPDLQAQKPAASTYRDDSVYGTDSVDADFQPLDDSELTFQEEYMQGYKTTISVMAMQWLPNDPVARQKFLDELQEMSNEQIRIGRHEIETKIQNETLTIRYDLTKRCLLYPGDWLVVNWEFDDWMYSETFEDFRSEYWPLRGTVHWKIVEEGE